jgi:hypothetical protein
VHYLSVFAQCTILTLPVDESMHHHTRIANSADAAGPTKVFKALRKASKAPSTVAELNIETGSTELDREMLSEACR